MQTLLTEFATALEAYGIGAALLSPPWLLPAIAVFHLLSMVLLAGPVLLYDFRLLGLSFPSVSVRNMQQRMQPLLLTGLSLALVSGCLLFAAAPSSYVQESALLAKGALLLAAAANALWYRSRLRRAIAAQAEAVLAEQLGHQGFARECALLSIVLWSAIIVCGALLSAGVQA